MPKALNTVQQNGEKRVDWVRMRQGGEIVNDSYFLVPPPYLL